MKDKLLDALKSKFPGVSETTLNIVATNKAGKVKDEAQLTSVVESITIDNLIEAVTDSKVADSNKQAVLNAAKKSNMEYKDGILTPIQQTKPPEPPADDTPAWAKQMMEQNKQLADRIAGIESKNKQQGLTDKLIAKLKEKKIPLSLIKGHVLNEETEVETAFTEIEATYNEIRQEQVNNETPETLPGGAIKAQSKEQLASVIDGWVAGKTPTSSETKK